VLFALYGFVNVHAETYLGAQGGVVFHGKTIKTQLAGMSIPPGSSVTNLNIDSSFLYGIVFGHYFNSHPWLGVGIDLNITNRHIPSQDATINLASFGPIAGTSMPMEISSIKLFFIDSDIYLLFRYQNRFIDPYLGLGVGYFYVREKVEGFSTKNHAFIPSLNGRVGLRRLLGQHVAIAAEYKIIYSKVSLFPREELSGLSFNYYPQSLTFSTSYVF